QQKPMKTYLILALLLLLLVPALAQDESADIDLTPPEFGSFDPESIADINIEDYPILPELTDYARIIFERGKETGRNSQVFSKVGDCMTASEPFMTPFGGDDYDLGEYTHLAEVVEHFSAVPARGEGFELNAFNAKGLATETGYNTATALDSIWSDPNWCGGSESPLECEYRVTSSAFALIMFGTNDVQFISEADFDYYLRNVIIETINHDVVPVLYTFPDRPEFLEKSDRYNQIIIKVAQDYDLPLINFWLSLKDLPDSGVDVLEPIHLTLPEDGNTGIFTEERLNMGYTHRNLVTLQALDILLKGLIQDDETESVSS
ncbi:MAG: hypothetical protein ACPG7F_07055, partial [Aggregatilineales bacterium]